MVAVPLLKADAVIRVAVDIAFDVRANALVDPTAEGEADHDRQMGMFDRQPRPQVDVQDLVEGGLEGLLAAITVLTRQIPGLDRAPEALDVSLAAVADRAVLPTKLSCSEGRARDTTVAYLCHTIRQNHCQFPPHAHLSPQPPE